MSQIYKPNPSLDLVLEREVDVPPERLWRGWTQPEILKKWFCPLPWKTVECRIDLRPGGEFYTVMQSPEGQNMPAGTGCYLAVETNKQLTWTNALAPGFRPVEHESDALIFTAMILMEPTAKGTKYKAIAMHTDEAGRHKHEAMGFHQGWGAALDQLVALSKTL
jgi:uncharacterized protein YndB with AHSA1/START domain